MNWENKGIEKYDKIIEKICKNQQVEFIPLFDLINEKDLIDGMHPHAKGHEKIFNQIKEYLLKTL